MLGTPWFWRAYIGGLLAAALIMRLTGWELPLVARRVGFSTVVGIMSFCSSNQWLLRREQN